MRLGHLILTFDTTRRFLGPFGGSWVLNCGKGRKRWWGRVVPRESQWDHFVSGDIIVEAARTDISAGSKGLKRIYIAYAKPRYASLVETTERIT